MSTPSFGPRDLAVHTQFIVFASGSPSHNTSLLLYNSDLFRIPKRLARAGVVSVWSLGRNTENWFVGVLFRAPVSV